MDLAVAGGAVVEAGAAEKVEAEAVGAAAKGEVAEAGAVVAVQGAADLAAVVLAAALIRPVFCLGSIEIVTGSWIPMR